MDYKNTIFLPKTDFSMKVNLSEQEEKIQLKKSNKDNPNKRWILHDGPPFANGDIHIGHTLNKVLKDVIVRNKRMNGYDSHFIPGWDCHGMPIEKNVSKTLGHTDVLTLRKACREEALRNVERQKKQFVRLGIEADWDNPYLTLNSDFESSQLDIFWKMYSSGQIYRGFKPVNWCIYDKTALAEAEIEHKNTKSTSIYVKFKINGFSDTYAVIWTTTPWTLPANLAIAVNPSFEYGFYKCGNDIFLLGINLALKFFEENKLEGKLVNSIKGQDLENFTARHPFLDRNSKFCLANYVNSESGTGLVHTAPAHGVEDYTTGQKYHLETLCPVDGSGKYNELFKEMEGKLILSEETTNEILDLLRKNEALIGVKTIEHSTAHCWRCHNKTIFLSTPQWFISMDRNNLRDKVLQQCEKVDWVNENGKVKFINMIKDRNDWCISRQRVWGLPIFVFYCKDCKEPNLNQESYLKIKNIIETEGSDKWFDTSIDCNYFSENMKCKCGCEEFTRNQETLDVWFDSGSSFKSVLKNKKQIFPANLYLEGSDQYRGWFQSSMILSVFDSEKSPYKSVFSTGWVLDKNGKAMHKSLGNVVDPLDVINKYSADILRLWCVSEDCKKDLTIGDNILKSTSESYKKIRLTFKWLLGALDSFKKSDLVEVHDLREFDQWVLYKTKKLFEENSKFVENYEFHRFVSNYNNFCNTFLSSVVFDCYKDKLYTLGKNDFERKSIQTTIYHLFNVLVKTIAPILVFTSQEAWQNLDESLKENSNVHETLLDFNFKFGIMNTGLDFTIESLDKEFNFLLDYKFNINKKIEELRIKKLIGKSYDVKLVIPLTFELDKHKDFLPELFLVSEVSLEEIDDIEVLVSDKRKCERCWRKVCKPEEEICDRCKKVLSGV